MSLGVLTSSVPRDVVDEVVEASRRRALRSDGKLPPHVMVYFTMALALFADDDYEEVATRLAGTLAWWGCWDDDWQPPTSGGLTQARQRLGYEPVKMLFEQVAQPVAEPLTRGAFLAGWRLMAIDGFEWDAPDTAANAAEFGYAGGSEGSSAFPKVRVVTLSECGSHAMVAGEIGGRGGTAKASEQALARHLYPRLEPGWLLIADRGFYGYHDWRAAARTGAQLLWRVKTNLKLPELAKLGDGSYLSVVINPEVNGRPARRQILDAAGDAAAGGAGLDDDQAMLVRVVEYTVTAGEAAKPEVIRLISTIIDPAAAPAGLLAQAYHERWEHETSNNQIKTQLRGPSRVLRSQSPDLVRAEIYGYLLTHHAISELICQAATDADIDPDRVKFKRTVRIVRRSVSDTAAFSP